jgi:hypothetical protein
VLSDKQLAEALRRELQSLAADAVPSPELMDRLMPRPSRGRRQLWWAVPAAALAGLLLVAVFATSGVQPSPAFAFTIPSGKSVRVTLQQITAIRPANARLRRLGRVRAIAMTDSCKTATAGLNYAEVEERPTPRISLVRPPSNSSSTLIVAAKRVGVNRIVLAIGTVTGMLPSCVSSHGSGPGLPGFHAKSDGHGGALGKHHQP